MKKRITNTLPSYYYCCSTLFPSSSCPSPCRSRFSGNHHQVQTQINAPLCFNSTQLKTAIQHHHCSTLFRVPNPTNTTQTITKWKRFFSTTPNDNKTRNVFSQKQETNQTPTIFALSTAPGKSAIAIIRVSGPNALNTLKLLVNTKENIKQPKNNNNNNDKNTIHNNQQNTRTQTQTNTIDKIYDDQNNNQFNIQFNVDENRSIENIQTLNSNQKDNKDGDFHVSLPLPRVATLYTLINPHTQESIDKCMVIYFPSPNSYTGDHLIELHVHGSRAVIHEVLTVLSSLPWHRMAQAGEFTQRAFENGKLDLTEVEGIADLIHAETTAQRKMALSQMQGSLSEMYSKWRNTLIRSLSYMEAIIDFSEDEQIDMKIIDEVKEKVTSLIADMSLHLLDGKRGERMREGAQIAIIGPPNAGKSSLVNILANRKVSIVSSIAGTTRDVIEVLLDIGGFPVVIRDTAGIRHSTDQIELEGMARAKERFNTADIQICVLDINQVLSDGISPVVKELINPNTIILLNKIDLNESINPQRLQQILSEYKVVVSISCNTMEGITTLLSTLSVQLKDFFEGGQFQGPLLTRLRHREHLEKCVQFLKMYLQNPDIVLATEELRYSINELGSITGKVNVDMLLDVIFRDFCIGK